MYELRIYASVPGRVSQIVEGLRHNARTLFVKYGFRPVSFWQTVDTAESAGSVIYLLKWRDEAEQQESWTALRADAAWATFLAETQRCGPAIAGVTSIALDDIPDMPLSAQRLYPLSSG